MKHFSGLIAVTALAVSVLTLASNADADGGRYFVEGSIAGAVGQHDDLTFVNPVGTAFTSNAIDGNNIILQGVDDLYLSAGGDAAFGYQYNPNISIKAVYSYLGHYEASGDANFGAGNFRQDLDTDAHSVMLKLGYAHPVTQSFFVEGTLGAGVSILTTEAKQGDNLGDDNALLSNTNVNPAFSVAAGVGYKISNNLSTTLTGEYVYAGHTETDTTTGAENAATGINVSEQLNADILIGRVLLGLKYHF